MDKTHTILIVEDDALMRASVAGALRGSRVSIIESENGQEGLAIALAKHPDLIMLDLAMPQLDGISVIRRLREDAWGKKANIILLTSIDGSDAVMREVSKHNPAYCFVKDRVSMDEVAAKAYQLLGISK